MSLHLLGLYFGPDQVMPVASIVATVAGLILIFWGKLVGMLRRITGLSRRSSEDNKVGRTTGKQPTQQP